MNEESKRKIVDEQDAWEVCLLLEEMNRFLHQPANYESSVQVVEWLQSGVYERLKRAYYDIGDKWFPVDEETGHVLGPGGRPHLDD